MNKVLSFVVREIFCYGGGIPPAIDWCHRKETPCGARNTMCIGFVYSGVGS